MPIPGLASAVIGAIDSVDVFLSDNSSISVDTLIANASVSVLNDGSIVGDGNIANFNEPWISPISAAKSAYDVKAEQTSGDAPSGSALATWLNLATSRGWTLSASAPDVLGCTLLISIRRASSGEVLAQATYTIGATAT